MTMTRWSVAGWSKRWLGPAALALGALGALYGGPALASYPAEITTLPWAGKGEQLTYHSCGCADSCWVAELRERRSRRLRARLRCDCDSLYALYPGGRAERQVADTCDAINDQPDKMAAVAKQMKRIVDDGRAK